MAFEDIAGLEDLDIDEVVRGGAAIAEAFGRRITTRELWYDLTYVCIDLHAYQSRVMDDAELWRLKVAIERCRQAETRIADATIDVAWYALGMELRVKVDGTTVDGDTFELVATVDNEGVRMALVA